MEHPLQNLNLYKVHKRSFDHLIFHYTFLQQTSQSGKKKSRARGRDLNKVRPIWQAPSGVKYHQLRSCFVFLMSGPRKVLTLKFKSKFISDDFCAIGDTSTYRKWSVPDHDFFQEHWNYVKLFPNGIEMRDYISIRIKLWLERDRRS